MASQKAKINTLLFYHWDNTLFDNMALPESVDRDTVVKAILLETSEFPLVITDLDTLKMAIVMWSSHKVDIWEHLLETTRYIYNPIENYNRIETEQTVLQKRGTGTIKGDGGNDTITYNLADSNTEDTTVTEQLRSNVVNDVSISKDTSNSIINAGSDRTVNSGTDVKTVSDVNTETNSGSDVITIDSDIDTSKTGSDSLSISGSESKTRTGYDLVSEGVSAFNEQNVYSDHTQTQTDYNSGESLTTSRTDTTTYNTTETVTDDKTETTDFGKETVNDRSIDDRLTYGKTENITYGKTETQTGTGTETSSGETLTTGNNTILTGRLGSGTKTGTETHKHEQGNIETRNFDDTFSAERHMRGNIGVTTTQEMIEAERRIALFDIVDIIVSDYKEEFCIVIY